MTYLPLIAFLALVFVLVNFQREGVSFNLRTLLGLGGGLLLSIFTHVCQNQPIPLKSLLVLQTTE